MWLFQSILIPCMMSFNSAWAIFNSSSVSSRCVIKYLFRRLQKVKLLFFVYADYQLNAQISLMLKITERDAAKSHLMV